MNRKQKPLLAILFVVVLLLGAVLVACDAPIKVTSIEIVNLADLKTTYIENEEFDSSGIVFKVTYNDNTFRQFEVEEIRKDLVFSNTSTAKERVSQAVGIQYKGVGTLFYIKVVSKTNSQIVHKVSFHTGSVVPPTPIETTYGSTIAQPEEPVRGGYYFVGWYKTEEHLDADKWEFDVDKVTDDITLYAKWNKFLTVYFAIGDKRITRSDVREGETYLDYPAVDPIPGKIGSWDYNGEWDDLVDQQVIYAKYVDEQYSVVFQMRNQQNDPVSVTIPRTFVLGDNVAVLSADFLATMSVRTPLNQNLKGWSVLGIEGSKDDFRDLPGFQAMRNNLTIVAEYQWNVYDVIFDFGVGSDYLLENAPSSITVTGVSYDTLVPTAEVPNAESYVIDEYRNGVLEPLENRVGKAFGGWYRSKQYVTEWMLDNDRVTTNITLHAKWIDMVYLHFYVDGPDKEPVEVALPRYTDLLPSRVPKPQEIEGKIVTWKRLDFNNVKESAKVEYDDSITRTYEVIYYVDGEEFAREEVEHNQNGKLKTKPSKEHFNFMGWRISGGDSTVYDVIKFVTEPLLVDAVFERILFDVVFNDEEKGVVGQQKIGSGLPIADSAPQDPTREGYQFDGWLLANNAPWDIENDPVLGPMELFAKQTKLHTVRFTYKDPVTKDEATLIKSVRDKTVIDPVPEIPKLEGYEAVWRDANGNVVQFATYLIVNAHTFHADYTLSTYRVVFRWPGNEHVVAEVEHGKLASELQAPIPTRRGYRFTRWDKDLNNIVVKSDLYVDAIFTALRMTVKFRYTLPDNSEVDQIIEEVENVPYGGTVSLPKNVPNKEDKGFRFEGWKRSNAGITASDEELADEDNIVTYIDARYVIMKYRVTFLNPNTQEQYFTTQIEHGRYLKDGDGKEIKPSADVVTPPKGQHFVEWTFDFETVITETTEIYPVFERNEYTITYVTMVESSEAALESDTATCLHGDSITEPIFSHMSSNRAFMGWYTNTEHTNRYQFGTKVEGDFRLYAKWVQRVAGDGQLVYSFDIKDGVRVATLVGLAKDEDGNPLINVDAPFEITVPNYVENKDDTNGDYLVSIIGEAAFYQLTNLTRIHLQEGLERIGNRAFAASGLVSMVVPKTVSVIGESAFENCKSLTTVVLAEANDGSSNLKNLEAFAFAGCTSLTYIGANAVVGTKTNHNRMPNSLERIRPSAFYGATALTNLVLGENMVLLGANAFGYASSLKYLELKCAVAPALGENAFVGVSKTFRLYVPKATSYLSAQESGWPKFNEDFVGRIHDSSLISSDYNWAYTESLGKKILVQYLGSATNINLNGDAADGVDALEVSEVENGAIGQGVQVLVMSASIILRAGAIMHATDLAELVLTFVEGKGFASVNSAVLLASYQNLPNLNKLGVSARFNMTLVSILGGSPPAALKTVEVLNDGENLVLPVSMFENCNSIQHVVLPDSLVSIGNNAFKDCSDLTTVEISLWSSLKTIGVGAFQNASKLSAEGLTIPTGVTKVGAYALDGTKLLADFQQNQTDTQDDNRAFFIVGDNILYHYVSAKATNKTSVQLPATVKQINDYAFAYNHDIVSVMFQRVVNGERDSALARIGANAFLGCSQLEAVFFGLMLKTVEEFAFKDASKLGKFVLMRDGDQIVPTLGYGAFENNMDNFVAYSTFAPTTEKGWGTTPYSQIENLQFSESGWIVSVLSTMSEERYLTEAIYYCGEETEVVLPKDLAISINLRISKINGYAFPRTTTAITVDLSTQFSESAFYGLSRLTQLTLVASSVRGGVDADMPVDAVSKKALGELVDNNKQLTRIELPGLFKLTELFGGKALPKNVTTVKVTSHNTTDAGETARIVPEMFAGCEFVNNIEFSSYLAPDRIGKNAFVGSGFVKNWDVAANGAFVYYTRSDRSRVVLAYLGKDSVLVVPHISDVPQLVFAAYALADQKDIEVLFIEHTNVVLNPYVFSGMDSLTHIFYFTPGENGKTAGIAQSFLSERVGSMGKVQFFVPSLANDSFGTWANALSTKATFISMENVNHVQNGVSQTLKTAVAGTHDFTKGSLVTTSDKKATLVKHFAVGALALPATIKANEEDLTLTKLNQNALLKGVTSLTFDAALQFESGAFGNLSGVEKVLISGVNDVANLPQAFEVRALLAQNKGLKHFGYDGSKPLYELLEGNVLPAHVETLEFLASATVSRVADFALAYMQTVKDILFPNTLTAVGSASFDDTAWYLNYKSDMVVVLDGLLYKYKGSATLVTVPKTVKTIGEHAFSHVRTMPTFDNITHRFDLESTSWRGSNVQTLYFEAGAVATHILDKAFENAARLVSVELVKSLVSVPVSAFDGTGIKRKDGLFAVTGRTGTTILDYNGTAEHFTVQNDVVAILGGAFQNNQTLTTLSFAEGARIERILYAAFKGCSSLVSVGEFPKSLTFLDPTAFDDTPYKENKGKTELDGEQTEPEGGQMEP